MVHETKLWHASVVLTNWERSRKLGDSNVGNNDMDGSHHNSERHLNNGARGLPADGHLELPDELRAVSHDLDLLAREDALLANAALLDRIASTSWAQTRIAPTTLRFEGKPVTIARRERTVHSNYAMRLAAAVAILATGAAAFFALRSSPISNNSNQIASNNNAPGAATATLSPEEAQIESDLALLDDIWGDGDGSTSDLWASASDIENSVATDPLDELFSTEETTQ